MSCKKGEGVAEETEGLNLTDEQKTRLLGLALGAEQPAGAASEDEQRGDLLWDMLRRSLAADRRSGGAVSLSAGASRQGLRTALGLPLGEVLQDPKTDVSVFRQIKDHAKRLGEQAASTARRTCSWRCTSQRSLLPWHSMASGSRGIVTATCNSSSAPSPSWRGCRPSGVDCSRRDERGSPADGDRCGAIDHRARLRRSQRLCPVQGPRSICGHRP